MAREFSRMTESERRALDALLAPQGSHWWDSYYQDRAKPCPFFGTSPDESLAPHCRTQYVALVVGALKPGGWFDLACFRPEGGSGYDDDEVYQRGSLGGGLGYTEAQLRDVWSSELQIRFLRPMAKQSMVGQWPVRRKLSLGAAGAKVTRPIASIAEGLGMTQQPLSRTLPGTWELLSRVDVTASGERRTEPSLGEDPVAVLMYDRSGHFAAQFMRRDRSVAIPDGPGGAKNNSRAQGGYDAYFGTYTIDDTNGTVTQRLHGALSQENVGAVLTRAMEVKGDLLVIKLETSSATGEAVTRTLTWQRIG